MALRLNYNLSASHSDFSVGLWWCSWEPEHSILAYQHLPQKFWKEAEWLKKKMGACCFLSARWGHFLSCESQEHHCNGAYSHLQQVLLCASAAEFSYQLLQNVPHQLYDKTPLRNNPCSTTSQGLLLQAQLYQHQLISHSLLGGLPLVFAEI